MGALGAFIGAFIGTLIGNDIAWTWNTRHYRTETPVKPRNDDELCRLKREAKQRGEHIC